MAERTENRRKADRIPSNFRAELYLIFPEVSFQPVPFLVHVLDASRDGLHLRVPKFNEKQFERLLGKIEYGLFVLRNEQQVVRIYCAIVWKDRVQLPDNTTTYDLGVRFDLRSEDSSSDVDFILERARRQQIAREG
jgi:hypothetical protein